MCIFLSLSNNFDATNLIFEKIFQIYSVYVSERAAGRENYEGMDGEDQRISRHFKASTASIVCQGIYLLTKNTVLFA